MKAKSTEKDPRAYWYNIVDAWVGEMVVNNYNEDWKKINSNHYAYKFIEEAINNLHYGKLDVEGAAEVEGGDYYLAALCGGYNGGGPDHKWTEYLDKLGELMKTLGHSWLVDMYNDCCDDVWYAVIAYDVPKCDKKEDDKVEPIKEYYDGEDEPCEVIQNPSADTYRKCEEISDDETVIDEDPDCEDPGDQEEVRPALGISNPNYYKQYHYSDDLKESLKDAISQLVDGIGYIVNNEVEKHIDYYMTYKWGKDFEKWAEECLVDYIDKVVDDKVNVALPKPEAKANFRKIKIEKKF